MKHYLLIVLICLAFFRLDSIYIPDIDTIMYHNDVIRVNDYYESSIVIHGDRLFIDSKYALEEYSIDEEGDLELLSYDLIKYNHCIVPMKTQGNTIYQALIHLENSELESKNVIRALEVADDGLVEVNSLEFIDPWEGIYNIQVNEEYLFYMMTGSNYTTVLNRETFEVVTEELLTGGRFAVRDSLLFTQMIQYPDSTYVSIRNISNVTDPVELGRIYSNDLELNSYEFVDNLMIIMKQSKVIITDISDPSNPTVLSTLDNFPGLPGYNVFINAVISDNYLVLMNASSMLYVFEISNLHSPVLVNSYTEPGSLSRLKKPLAKFDRFIYFGDSNGGLSRLDGQLLPQIVVESACLQRRNIGNNYLKYPYYFFTIDGDLFYFNVYDESEIVQLSDDLFHTRFYTANDSLLFYILKDIETPNEEKYLRIYGYNEYGIEHLIDHYLDNAHPTLPWLYWKEPFLLLRNQTEESYRVHTIDQNYDLIYQTDLIVPDSNISWIINQGAIGPDDYLYVYCFTTQRILIFDYQFPFDLLYQINITQYGNYNQPYMAEEDLFIFYRYPWLDSIVNAGLYSYEFPDLFSVLGELNISSRTFLNFTNSNVLHIADFMFTPREFYYFDHSGLSFLGSYNFENTHAYYIHFLPELSKLYVSDADPSSKYIRRYDLDYVSSVDEEQIFIPSQINLAQNYPNPFNPETTIKFTLTRTDRVVLEIFNIKGQKVSLLIDDVLPEGEHTVVWSPQSQKGNDLPSGIYLYRLKTESYVQTRKMLYLK